MGVIALFLAAVIAKADVSCWHCLGQGVHQATCNTCAGMGDVLIDWGDGRWLACESCFGSGVNSGGGPCNGCNNQGYLWEEGYWEDWSTCWTCTGNGWVAEYCWVCFGSGSLPGYSGEESVSVDNPWAVVDEDGVGTLGSFGLENRSSSLPSAAEWLGMAVGIFVEPVDWVMTVVEIYRDPANPASYLGLIPGIPAGIGKLVKKSVNIATDVLEHLPYGKTLKMGDKKKGMTHILIGHAHNTPDLSKGKFKAGWHMNDIERGIGEALSRSNGAYVDLYDGKEIYEVLLGNPGDVIGRAVVPNTGAVSYTRKIRVVIVHDTGEVITAYPIPE